MPDPVTANVLDVSQNASKPHSSFRLIFFVLLIAVLLSAAASSYILMNWNVENPESQVTTQTEEENPLVIDTSTNPFEDEIVSDVETETPFVTGTSTNPFAAFATEAESESGNSGEYVNPF